MTSKERILCTLNGKRPDHIPLTTWCFGFQPPEHLKWASKGEIVNYWYTKRLEFLHSLPQVWSLEDDFKRALAWLSLGVDDVIDVSVPWSLSHQVTWKDSVIPPGGEGGDVQYPVMVREYDTPLGKINHSVRQTGKEPDGWPVQPDHVPVIEDYNIPRAKKHLISEASEIDKLQYLYCPPDAGQRSWYDERMASVRKFSDDHGLFVQAWTAFGMDAVVWFTGVDGAVTMSMTEPEAFQKLINIVEATDYARTELAVKTPGIDMVCQRGWYSSTDFWSPELFIAYVLPGLKKLTALAHKNGKKFGYVMTTGVETLGPLLADAGVDLLYFVDPVQDGIPLTKARELFGNRMTMAGGINSISLASADIEKIRNEVKAAIDILGPTNRFILHPVDAIFPDTPWRGVEAMINAWKEYQE
jgi:hypothetical protein